MIKRVGIRETQRLSTEKKTGAAALSPSITPKRAKFDLIPTNGLRGFLGIREPDNLSMRSVRSVRRVAIFRRRQSRYDVNRSKQPPRTTGHTRTARPRQRPENCGRYPFASPREETRRRDFTPAA